MKLLFRCFLEQTPSLDIEETIAELTATLFQETDIDQSGDISLEELTSAFQRNEHLFKVLSLRYSIGYSIRLLFKQNQYTTTPICFYEILLVQAVGFDRNQHR